MEGPSSMGVENGKQPQPPPRQPASQWKAVVVASIAIGLSFGWALQFSLLTPYVQLLGIPHKWASFIWLCGPISGIVVQPLAGYYSDRCSLIYGRRRPFIAGAAALVAVSVVLIGFAADFGRLCGDPVGDKPKPRAITIFVVGFWVFDVGNNLLMAPCRALLSDLSGDDQRATRNANALFSFFTSVGNVLGYAAGSYSGLHKFLPFTYTGACVIYCANLKTCLLISITLLLTLTVVALSTVSEDPITKPENSMAKTVPFFGELYSALKSLPRSMWYLLLAASLNSLAFFAWLLYDTDWMGREVYGGVAGEELYDQGVHAGSLGLMLNAAVAGVTALVLIFAARDVKTGNVIWGVSTIFLAGFLASTVWITRVAESERRHNTITGSKGPEHGVKAAALTLFAVLGIPQAVIYTIPFALAATYSATVGLGQGLAMGILNLSFVIPQLVVSLTSGPWDELFGGGNLPAFVVGAIAAAVSGVLILTLLPSSTSGDKPPTLKTSVISH